MQTNLARDEQFSRLLFGTLTMGPLQANLSPEEGGALIAYAASHGVNFVDTAEYYQTYPHVCEALRVHPELRVCTKSYAYDRAGAQKSLEMAQEGIGREFIDIFLMHEQESEHTLRGHAEALAYYLERRDAGLIGRVGISTHHVAAVRAAMEIKDIDVIFAITNQMGLGVADGTRQEMESALEEAHARGIMILGMKALGGGHLIMQRESALEYALSLSFVDSLAIGMRQQAEIDYNIALFAGKRPSDQSAAASFALPRRLIVEEYCEGCGKCVKRCGQNALSLAEGRAHVDLARCVRCGYCAGVCPVFCLKVV